VRTSAAAVTATVGGLTIPVLYAGAQSEYPGLDQINIGPLPRTPSGQGQEVTVLVKMDGKETNPVTIAIR
jgi:uncharacterized protein (TIGR03437 family)